MASGSASYSSINKGRAAGAIPQSGAARRTAGRIGTSGARFQTSNPNAADFTPF